MVCLLAGCAAADKPNAGSPTDPAKFTERRPCERTQSHQIGFTGLLRQARYMRRGMCRTITVIPSMKTPTTAKSAPKEKTASKPEKTAGEISCEASR
jgi:hypothetical protein